jgi:hypothetical protein
MNKSAIISPCKFYLYRLERDREEFFGKRKTAALFGVNPSTADALDDDHTIRKLYGFGNRIDVTRWIVGNKFAFRAKDVNALKTAQDPIGHDNDKHIEQIMRDADLHIVAWGPLAKLPKQLRGRWREVVAIAERVGCPLYCLGVTLDGQPRHPLMLGYDTQLVRWNLP